MYSTLIIIIILNLLAAVVVLSTTDNIFLKKKSIKGKVIPFTTKGTILISTFLLTICITIWQYFENKRLHELDTAQRDSADSIHRFKSDSTAKAEIANGKNETIEALAKYNLRLDSTNGEIVQFIKDAKKTTVMEGVDPDFGIKVPSGIKLVNHTGDTYKFSINLTSRGAPSTGFNIKVFIVSENTAGKLNLHEGSFNLLAKNFKQPVSAELSKPISISGPDPLLQVHFILTGTYQNISKTKTFSLGDIYTYDFPTGAHISLSDANYSKVKTHLEKAKIYLKY